MNSPYPEASKVIGIIERDCHTLVGIAQLVIASWDWDDGGCCEEIAVALCIELDSIGIDAHPLDDPFEDHTFIRIPVKQGFVSLDIPWREYETCISFRHYAPTGNQLTENDLVYDLIYISPIDLAREMEDYA